MYYAQKNLQCGSKSDHGLNTILIRGEKVPDEAEFSRLKAEAAKAVKALAGLSGEDKEKAEAARKMADRMVSRCAGIMAGLKEDLGNDETSFDFAVRRGSLAKEPPPALRVEDANEELDGLRKEKAAFDRRLAKLKRRFDEATAANKPQIAKQYEDMIAVMTGADEE